MVEARRGEPPKHACELANTDATLCDWPSHFRRGNQMKNRCNWAMPRQKKPRTKLGAGGADNEGTGEKGGGERYWPSGSWLP